MVSDFIDEQNGYLQLTEEEFSRARETIPDLKRYARAYQREQGRVLDLRKIYDSNQGCGDDCWVQIPT